MIKMGLTQNKLQQKRFIPHFKRNFSLNNILKVYQNRSGGTMPNLHKFKMAAIITEYAYILGCMTPRDLVLVAKLMFSGSRNAMTIKKRVFDHPFTPHLHNFKMATILNKRLTGY